MADLIYRKHNEIFTMFYPENVEGEDAWRQIVFAYKQLPDEFRPTDGSVYNSDLPKFLRQLRKAGYIVKKAPKPKYNATDSFSEKVRKTHGEWTTEDQALYDALSD